MHIRYKVIECIRDLQNRNRFAIKNAICSMLYGFFELKLRTGIMDWEKRNRNTQRYGWVDASTYVETITRTE